ncbi:hypothetical protein HN51_022616 [Arachis hypogaea]
MTVVLTVSPLRRSRLAFSPSVALSFGHIIVHQSVPLPWSSVLTALTSYVLVALSYSVPATSPSFVLASSPPSIPATVLDFSVF